MVREGLLTAKEAENASAPQRPAALDGRRRRCRDRRQRTVRVQEGDIFILCSDGLHGLVKEPELKEIAALPIDEAADEYVKRRSSAARPTTSR